MLARILLKIELRYDILSGYSNAAVERMRIVEVYRTSEHPWTQTVLTVLEPCLCDLPLPRKRGENNNNNNNNKNNGKNNRTATASLSRPNNNN